MREPSFHSRRGFLQACGLAALAIGTPLRAASIGTQPATCWSRSIGSGRPIVFLHGWGMDHDYELTDYEPVFEHRPGWRRIYPDLPGMGRTPARANIHNQDDMLAVVLDFIDATLPGQRFVLAGTSAGGYLARGVVLRRGHLMDGLLLRVPMVVAADGSRDVDPFHPLVEDQALMARLPEQQRKELGDVLVQRPAYVQALRQKLETRILPALKRSDAAFLSAIRDDPKRYAFSFDVDQLPAPFPAPSLIIAGHQDENVGYRDSWRLLKNYPRATYTVLDRGRHAMPIDEQALFRSLVADWLDRVDEYCATRHV